MGGVGHVHLLEETQLANAKENAGDRGQHISCHDEIDPE